MQDLRRTPARKQKAPKIQSIADAGLALKLFAAVKCVKKTDAFGK